MPFGRVALVYSFERRESALIRYLRDGPIIPWDREHHMVMPLVFAQLATKIEIDFVSPPLR